MEIDRRIEECKRDYEKEVNDVVISTACECSLKPYCNLVLAVAEEQVDYD